MNNINQTAYVVGAGETDPSGFCRASALQGFLQDAATVHSQILDFAREDIVKQYGAVWILTRCLVRLRRPILSGEEISVVTWHRGSRGAGFYRDFDLAVGGQPVGEAVHFWVVADSMSGRVLRPDVLGMAGAAPPDRVKDILLSKLPPAADPVLTDEHSVCYADLDINNHMNNVRYTDLVCNALARRGVTRMAFEELRINFLGQSVLGETLRMYCADLPNGHIAIVGEAAPGDRRFEADALLIR